MSEDWRELQHELAFLKDLYKKSKTKSQAEAYQDITLNRDQAVSSDSSTDPGREIADGLDVTDLLTVYIVEVTGGERWTGSYTFFFGDIRAVAPFTKFEIRYQHDLYLKRDGDSLYASRSGISPSNNIRVIRHS